MRPASQRAAASCIEPLPMPRHQERRAPRHLGGKPRMAEDDDGVGVGGRRSASSDAGPNPARPFDARGSAKASTTRLPPGPSGTPAPRSARST